MSCGRIAVANVGKSSRTIQNSRSVLFIAPSAYPLGGVATWLSYIVPGLRGLNWNVTLGLVQGRFHDVDGYLDVHPDDQVLRIPFGTGTLEGRVRRLVHAIRLALPDIVVAVNIADVTLAVDRIRASTDWSPRIAVALHAVQPDLISSISVCARVLDAVICTNRLACALVAKMSSVAPDCIHYAPCGVTAKGVATRQKPLTDGMLRIAYVGRLERPQKRVDDIGAIVAELGRRGIAYELVIAGGGPDAEWMRAQLSKVAAEGAIRFLGTLTSTDLIHQVYSWADILLITSLWETGPIVAWEAMANGVAVVTSAFIGSVLEGSLESGVNCLMFPIGDALAAANCLQKLRDANLRNRLIRGGYALVSSRYTMATSIAQWDGALVQIAAKTPLSRRFTNSILIPPAGRLDRLFGQQGGEAIRELLGLKHYHRAPGGEWPHVSLCATVDEEAFWQLARSLDCRSTTTDYPSWA